MTRRRWLSASQQDGSSQQTPDQLEPCGGTSSLQNLGENVFLLFKPPCLWYLVMPAHAKTLSILCHAHLFLSRKAMMNCNSWTVTHSLVLHRVWLFATPWTVARQAPLPMGSSSHEYRSGWSFPPPGHLPSPGIEPASPAAPALQAGSLPLSHLGSPPRCIPIPMTCTCEILKNKDGVQCFW